MDAYNSVLISKLANAHYAPHQAEKRLRLAQDAASQLKREVKKSSKYDADYIGSIFGMFVDNKLHMAEKKIIAGIFTMLDIEKSIIQYNFTHKKILQMEDEEAIHHLIGTALGAKDILEAQGDIPSYYKGYQLQIFPDAEDEMCKSMTVSLPITLPGGHRIVTAPMRLNG